MALNEQQQIWQTIEKSNNILITFKKEFTGDSLASSLALFLFLQKQEKQVEIVADDFRVPRAYSFLPKINEIKEITTNLRQFIISLDISKSKVDEISYDIKDNELEFIVSPKTGFFSSKDISTRSSGFHYDLIITLDNPDLESLGKIYDNDTEFFFQTPVINIDHNSNNDNFGQINHVQLTATSVAELIYDLTQKKDAKLIDEDIATCLLTGMIAKTHSFKTSNVTPQTLNIASQLIQLGARREEIVQNLYRSRTLASLKLWGRVLTRLQNDPLQYLVWSYLTQPDFKEAQAKEEDVEGVIDELIANAPDARIIVLLYEREDRSIAALVNTEINLNALELTQLFEPTGSKNLARFTLKNVPITQAQEKIIAEITRMMKLKNRK